VVSDVGGTNVLSLPLMPWSIDSAKFEVRHLLVLQMQSLEIGYANGSNLMQQ
jgi:hypothetical protein